MTALKRTILLLYVICPAIGMGQLNLPPVYKIVSDTFGTQEIDSTYWQVLEDNAATFTIKQVNSQPFSKQFHSAHKKAVRDSGYTIWMRCRLQNIMSTVADVSIESKAGKTDLYIVRGDGSTTHFITGRNYPYSKKDGFKKWDIVPFTMLPGETVLVYMRKHNNIKFTVPPNYKIPLHSTAQLSQKAITEYQDGYIETTLMYLSFFSGLLLLAGILNFLVYWQTKDKVNLYFSLFLVFIAIAYNPLLTHILPRDYHQLGESIDYFSSFSLVFFLFFIRHYFQLFAAYPRYDKLVVIVTGIIILIKIVCIFIAPDPAHWLYKLHDLSARAFSIIAVVTFIIASLIAIKNRTEPARIFLIAVLPLIIFILVSILLAVFVLTEAQLIRIYNTNMYLGGFLVVWAVIVFSKHLFKQYGQQQKQLLQIELDREIEQADFMAKQKVELEQQVNQRTEELNKSLQQLQATQKQLVQSEKMASLGELTAGIAHEIQNPLNFVNNFSEVNAELIAELNEEVRSGNQAQALSITENMNDNLQKIIYHGKRADAIVKNMLQHSQTAKSKKELTDINALADEYLRLSYHGLRAKDKNFNANFTTSFDKDIQKINVAPQDIGMVLLNLYNNAFYAVNEKKKSLDGAFSPTVTVSTKSEGNTINISIQDNGTGIPQHAIDKIFQPFFTTKPTGQGTGLGLSLSYDIIKAHGGEIKVETKEGEGSEFIIQLRTN